MSELPDIVTRFGQTALRRAAHPAVEAPEGTFAYAALDRLSNQLANRLCALGVGRDARVGISLPRGARELLALLATLKAGGAYVPLDPSHPAERLRGIVEDAAPQVMVVSSESPLATGPSIAGVPLLVLDDIVAATADMPKTAPSVDYAEEQLAYILFTSGSTGRPKGVEITRGAFANFLQSMAHTPRLSEDERLFAITTTSFDIAGLELFLPLWVGATTVIADRETARDPRALRRRLERDQISFLQATPATWRLLLEAGWNGDGRLRMLCGGEALSSTLADRLLGAGGELWNVYGPTETTVWSSLERILPGYDRITIGRPIDQTQIYILDETMNPAPVGQEGEIWIGGKGLARGYRGRPDLTAERFVQDPQGRPGDRIYRTGDLGRKLADGRFECLGRLDHQVKIRGFRIELGEIETILRGVSGVADVLVVADSREDGEPRLVAYWVGGADREALVTEAQRRLPGYMVPTWFLPLQAFPLNTNGKIDRKRLPKPETMVSERAPMHGPRTDVETRIAAVWRDVLGVDRVPVDQSFFTLGGISPLAVQVVSRIEQEMGVAISLQSFFETPTVEGLAASLGKKFSPDDPIVVWLRRGVPEEPPLFCLFGVTLYQDLALALGGTFGVVGAHVPFRYVPRRDRRPTLEEAARRYVELIRHHQNRGPYHLLGLCFGGIVAYEVARQLEQLGESVADVTIIDAVLPSAIHIDQLWRIGGNLARFTREPKALWRRLREQGRSLRRRIPIFGPSFAVGQAGAADEPIDLPVDGPEVDAEVKRFSHGVSKISARLFIVRATQEETPPWWTVDPDHGWGNRAGKVTVHDIPTTHVGVLREPHVQVFAKDWLQLVRRSVKET